MSSCDSSSVSGSSPTQRRKGAIRQWDFRVEFHFAIILLVPLTSSACAWANENIGAENGFQPYWPTVILEPRYLEGVIAGIRKVGLVAR
jgi:hypothetical protein